MFVPLAGTNLDIRIRSGSSTLVLFARYQGRFFLIGTGTHAQGLITLGRGARPHPSEYVIF